MANSGLTVNRIEFGNEFYLQKYKASQDWTDCIKVSIIVSLMRLLQLTSHHVKLKSFWLQYRSLRCLSV